MFLGLFKFEASAINDHVLNSNPNATDPRAQAKLYIIVLNSAIIATDKKGARRAGSLGALKPGIAAKWLHLFVPMARFSHAPTPCSN
jgi:hypothetical protein